MPVESGMATIADALREAARHGISHVSCDVSLAGGYDEDGERQRWTCLAYTGEDHRAVAVARGYTQEDAIASALQLAGVTW